jgi:hypothetical protein
LRKQTELSKRMTQEFAEKTIEQVYGGEGSFAPGFPDRWAPYHYDPLGWWRTWARALRETYEAANDARQTAVRTAQRTARDAQSRTAEETAKVVETTAPIALCSDIGPMLLPTSGGGMSGVTKRTALCLKIDIGGVVQYH